MRARDFRQQHATVLAIAAATQRDTIRRRMVTHCAGGATRLAKWDDNCFSLVWFASYDVQRVGLTMEDVAMRRDWHRPATPLRYLKELAEGGFIARHQPRPGAVVQFRFCRAKCDAIAAQVRAALATEGLQ